MMEMVPRIFVLIILGNLLIWTCAHTLEAEKKTQFKKKTELGKTDWKDWKLSEIQELVRWINKIPSSKDHNETQGLQNNKLDDICFTKECIHASNLLFKHMDLTADACENFNQFSCGTFIKEKSIPDDKSFYMPAFTPAADIG